MKKALLWLIVIALIAGAFLLWPKAAAPVPARPEASKVQAAAGLLQSSLTLRETFYADLDIPDAAGAHTASAQPNSTEALNYRDSARYLLSVPEAGWYSLTLAYQPRSQTLSDFIIALTINGQAAYSEMNNLLLPLYWRDETKDFPLDSYGDQSVPAQIRMDGIRKEALKGSLRSTAGPLRFPLQAGENLVEITNISNDGLWLGELTAQTLQETPRYADYSQRHMGQKEGGLIAVNAIDYTEKNSSQVLLLSEENPAMHPQDPTSKLLNILQFTQPGSQAVFRVEAPEDGLYSLRLRMKNRRQDLNAYIGLSIDGELPFLEAAAYALPDTGEAWVNHTLAGPDGTPYRFYLSKGSHSLGLSLEMEPLMRTWRLARLLSEHITRLALDITKVAGPEADRQRTWRMTRVMPEIPDYLAAYQTLMDEMRYESYQHVSAESAALLADLDRAGQFLDQVAEYPDEIALYLESLTGRDNSMLSALTTFASALSQNELSLDMLYLGQGDIPPADAGLIRKLSNGIARLNASFSNRKYRPAGIPEGTLDIWVNRALTHVDVLQKMADTEFTKKTGIPVKVSAMPDAGKLTLSAAAGSAPDVAMGLLSYMPFDLASRGALYDLTQFEDFWQVAGRFAPGAMVPYLFNDGVYAMPETMDFNALVYRRDIFEGLGFAVPDTWDEVMGLLPQLQRYGMNFYHNIATGVGYKWFYQTTPFIYQHGGSLYQSDGLRTAIDQPEAVAGIQALGNLFLAYSLDRQVNSFFNSFRYSVLPIGIMDATEYILLKNGAPELQGRWALAPYPGTVDEHGDIQRWYVSNGQGALIFGDTDMAEESWEFLKWWTQADTQVRYGHTLTSTYGDAFLWLSANLTALKDAPIDRSDKDVILGMAPWLRDVPRSPGQYMVERSISDIWNNMIARGVSAQVAADEKVIAVNREIRKKLQELGFMDQEGNLVKPYVVRDVDWIAAQIAQHKEAGHDD